MGRSRLAAVLVALAVVAGLGLRIALIEVKETLSHDEAISLIAATCHQVEYERIVTATAPPAGAWAPAAEWQRLIESEGGLCLGRIAEGLALHDIHPPLFFWVLHVWTLAVGTGVAAGALLNLMIVPLTALAVFGLARRVLGDPLEAAAAASLWALSPAVVTISSEARQYDLLALLAVLFVWQSLRLAAAPPGRAGARALGLAVLAAAGALTHYHFALVAVAGAGVLALGRPAGGGGRRAGAGRLALGVAAIAAGYAAFWAAHPGFATSFTRQKGQAGAFTAAGLGERGERTVTALAEFAAGELATPAVGYAFLAVGAALAAAALLRGGRRPGSMAGAEAAVLLVLAWLAGATVVLYLAFVSPINAMGGRYLAAVWPFLALAVVIGLRAAGRLRPALAVALPCVFAAFGVAQLLVFERGASRHDAPSPLETARGALVVDTLRRGILPAVLLGVPADKPVFAAPQPVLLDRRAMWLPRLDGEAAFASSDSYGNKSYPRRRLLGDIRSVVGGRRSVGTVRLWDSARPSGPHVIRVYRFGEEGTGRRSAGLPERGRQFRSR